MQDRYTRRLLVEQSDRTGEPKMRSYENQIAFLEAHNTALMGHSNQSLLDHLIGTRAILLDWNADDSLAAAGLFHSVYGTESFRQEAVPVALRPQVREVIGERAEELAYTFGAMAKETFATSVERGTDFWVEDRHTGDRIQMDTGQWSALCELVVANWLEQRPRAGAEYQQLKADMFRTLRRWLSAPASAALSTAYGFDPEVR